MKNLIKKSLTGKKAIVSMFAVVAVLALSLATMTSCETGTTGDMVYYVKLVDISDNMDALTSSIDEGFEKAGFKRVLNNHVWQIYGSESSCNKKASTAFQNRLQAIDKDRSLVVNPIIGTPAHMALKGKTVKLINLGSGSKEIEIDSYTFVGEDD